MGKMTLRRRKTVDSPPIHLIPPTAPLANKAPAVVKKKAGGVRLWMRMDRWGQSELMECDKSVITKRVSIPARDLRILGPIFSNSSRILAREKAMIVNLEFIRAIVTAEELLLLDPLCQEVLPFVDRLRRHLPRKIPSKRVVGQMVNHDTNMPSRTVSQWITAPEGEQDELPFEFQVLEIALEIICTYLDSSVAELERDAYPVLDELAINVSTKNLEHVRSLKNNLTRLLARVQKVRDEIEHLLDDNDDMAQLYLTRKWIQNQQTEALYSTLESNSVICAASHLRRLNSTRSASLLNSHQNDHHDIEDLEMLLEAYFIQLDRTRNKILSVREYIDDTEDYMNIKLDNKRNELIQLQLTITIATLAIAVETLLAGWFGMNIPCSLYNITGIFGKVVGLMTAASVALFSLIYGYARWKKLLGS